ncbi:MAG: hypothetical protein KGK30_10410, partial [Elusimicrobia bacterium]|nr:hypothetical protein [Elusimicrobiota bacterium]
GGTYVFDETLGKVVRVSKDIPKVASKRGGAKNATDRAGGSCGEGSCGGPSAGGSCCGMGGCRDS